MHVVCEVCGYNVSVPGQRCQPGEVSRAGGRRAVVPVFEIDVVEPWMEGPEPVIEGWRGVAWWEPGTYNSDPSSPAIPYARALQYGSRSLDTRYLYILREQRSQNIAPYMTKFVYSYGYQKVAFPPLNRA